jgi:hypothetical protein
MLVPGRGSPAVSTTLPETVLVAATFLFWAKAWKGRSIINATTSAGMTDFLICNGFIRQIIGWLINYNVELGFSCRSVWQR